MEPFLLIGEHVALEPLLVEHVEELVVAATEDRATYDWTLVPGDLAGMAEYVDNLLAERDKERTVPFVQRRLLDGQLVGCTRYLDIRSWSGRDAPDEAEVGGTWLAASAQRTPINTEAKILLLTHAFEHWRVHRVAICTASDNERSRRAIERLGATFEGVLRHHRPLIGDRITTPGLPRDTAVYSIIDGEWPELRSTLRARLDAH